MDNLAKQILKDVALEEIAPRARNLSPLGHWPSPILLERAAYLKKLARYGDGSASEALREAPQHTAMLSVRGRSSDAKMDESHAIFLCVLSGAATLVTGGTILRARQAEPGLTRGDTIDGGTPQPLKQGDIVHIPAGLAHQFLVAGENSITCFVIKIGEAE